jgi:hypothetical protein
MTNLDPTSVVVGLALGAGGVLGLLAALTVLLGARRKSPVVGRGYAGTVGGFGRDGLALPSRPNPRPDPSRGPDETYADRQGRLDETKTKRTERSQWDD